ncbi:hypothetical protein M8C13_05060 [Crossiella sp. SN42]|uniref:hypothetical protein n=1 Tax=Crossiella sp. SN42 TaxID=2944808 RepID=UPI00207C2E94|nr:hypothetical protein [Crossiella sp. SN42]MCO1575127.1 hypothetical protein [Crossiella sp. SN42]
MIMDLPGEYKLDVEPISGVDAELVEIGLQYWSLTGVDQYGEPTWETSVKNIDTRGRGQANVVAAAAVRAVLPDVQCSGCGQLLRLRSRSSLSDVLSGRATHCVDCEPKLVQRAAAVVAPETEESRRRREERQQQKEREQRLRETYLRGNEVWRRHQQHALQADFSGQGPTDEIPAASVRAELTTLALLRFAAQVDPIPPMRQWHHPFPFHAAIGVGPLINDARTAGLVLPHSNTPLTAFIWDPPTFEEAWTAAGGDLEKLEPPKRTDEYYPFDTLLRIPFGSSPDTGRALLDTHLCERLAPENMTAQRQEDLLGMVYEILVAEAIRWFMRELERHNLPEVAENHAPRLTEAVERLVAEYSLGFAYFTGWKAAKTAAAAAQANPRVPLRNMTTHGVSMFERDVQHALDNRPATLREFDESPYLPLAAMTKTLFYTVLRMDPMRTSLAAVRAAMPMPVPVGLSSEPGLSEPEWRAAGFRRGSSSWVEFAGDSPSAVLLRAAVYLAKLEAKMPVLAPSVHWEMFPTEYESTYGLRVELDGVHATQLPLEDAIVLSEDRADAKLDGDVEHVSLRSSIPFTDDDDVSGTTNLGAANAQTAPRSALD